MRPKSLVLLLLALGCGLVASIGINQVLATNRAKAPEPKGEMRSILVAMTTINLREELNVQNVRLEEWPVELVPDGALISLDEIDQRRSRTTIVKGEPILESKLLGKDAGASASVLIPKGYRSVSVRVDAVSGSSSLILPDDRVDVLVHIRTNQSLNIHQTVTRTILQDVRVFAVNDQVSRDSEELGDEPSIAAKTISLLVTPEQAELVTLATELGSIRLVLRSPEDEEAATTPGAEIAQLLQPGLEKNDADDESLMEEAGDDLLTFLSNEPEPEPEIAEPVEDENAWTMVLHIGSEVRQVKFTDDSPVAQEVPIGPQATEPLDGSGGAAGDVDADADDTDDPFDDINIDDFQDDDAILDAWGT